MGNEPVIGTRYGTPDIMMASVSNVANIVGAIDSLNSLKASMDSGAAAPTLSVGGTVAQNNEKDHSHKI